MLNYFKVNKNKKKTLFIRMTNFNRVYTNYTCTVVLKKLKIQKTP